MIEGYPKEITLKDGSKVVLRPMVKEDKERLREFFLNLPEEDRLFLRDDVTKEEVIETWVRDLNYQRVLPILALVGERVVGDATLHRRPFGWMRHIGEIRIVVAREFQRRGLGSLLAKEIFHQALKAGLEKLVAEMMADQPAALKVFEKLGFKKEAVFIKHVIDLKGKKHDLVVMTSDVADLWKRIEELILLEFPSAIMED